MHKVFLSLLILALPAIAHALEAKNNIIVIELCSLLPAEQIKKSLDPKKYQFKILQVPKQVTDPTACQTLWVGKSVPLNNVIEIKNIILNAGIELHYIGISGDYDYKDPPVIINHTITIGGSTNAAKSQGIRKLKNEEFDAIFSSNTQKQLHEKIRKTYSIASKRFWIEKLK